MVIIVIGLIAVSLFYLQKFIYFRLWDKELNVVLKFRDETVRAGESTILMQIVENRKWLPLPVLKVKFQCSGNLLFAADKSSQVTDLYNRNDMFSMMPYRRFTRNHKVICSKRGYYGIRGIDLVSADLFLTQEMVRSRFGETWIYVIPAIFDVSELDAMLQKISGEMAHRRHLLPDPFAFRGIREYTPFDELKTVNWKASARSDDLKVNIYDYSAVNSVSVFINVKNRQLSGSDEQIEKAMSIASYLAEVYLTNGIKFSIYANGKDIMTDSILAMEENQNRKQLEHINIMLARIDLNREVEPFTIFEERINQQKDRLVFIISPDWHFEFQDQLERIDTGLDYVWICPCRFTSDVKIRESLKAYNYLIQDKI